MKRKFGRPLAPVAVFGLFCTNCLGGGGPAVSAGKSTAPFDTKEPPTGDGEVTMGLGRGVYAIPNYTNAGDDVRVVRLSVSMNTSDYDTFVSGMTTKISVGRVEELFDGKMVVQVFPANQLVSTTDDTVNSLVTGAFEVSEMGQANWDDYTTAFTPLNVPFLYPNKQTVCAIMSGEIGDGMQEQLLADIDLCTVDLMHLGMHTLSNDSKGVHSLTDMKSMKLCAQSDPTQIAAFEESGVSVTTASFSGLFTALQQGPCDDQDSPIITIVSQRFYEIQNHITVLNHLPNLSTVTMSDTYYQSLSAEEQSWIDQTGQDTTEACYQTILDTTQILVNQPTDRGTDITHLTNEEYQVFEDSVPDTWAMCKEAMDTDAWNELLAVVEAVQNEA